jgi:poly(3-hydroxybutyrate) depolymerase
MNKAQAAWTRITVHHSADSMGELAAGSAADGCKALRDIQRFHMQDPGHRWGDIGYHFVIDPLGRTYEGRALAWQGAHAGGENNRANIGICVLGSYEKRSPPAPALAALEELIAALRARHSIARERVYGHGEFKKTVCPGGALTAWIASYRKSSDRSSSMPRLGSQPRAASAELSPHSSSASPGLARSGSSSSAGSAVSVKPGVD